MGKGGSKEMKEGAAKAILEKAASRNSQDARTRYEPTDVEYDADLDRELRSTGRKESK